MIDNELKELPEKWYIKPNTLEEAKIVAEYFDKIECGLIEGKIGFYPSKLEEVIEKGLSNNNWGFYKRSAHTEISFEQFKKWVLKEELEKKSLVGRYLKALIDYPQAGNVKAGEYGLITNHEKTSLEANFPSQHGYLCSGALEKNQTKYELMPEDFIPESNLETKKEPVVKLEIGNHYEITDNKGNKEIIKIVNIHTDIQKMNNLLNSDNDECNSAWNVECTVCIYEYKRISDTTLIRKVFSNDNVTTIKLFDYFSDDSPFAKSAKLVKTNNLLYSTLGAEGLYNNITGYDNTALGVGTATISFSTNNESKIHIASSSVNSQYPLTPTINLEFQEPIIITNKKQKVKQLFIIKN
jgi:hypothetical protein